MPPNLWPIISSVFGVILVMVIGGGCRRAGWLTREADRSLARLTTNLLIPSFFLDRILYGTSTDTLAVAWMPPVVGFVTTTVGFMLALWFARLVGPAIGLDTDAKQRAFGLCAGICNYGYIPLPLAEKFYENAVVDLILHNVGVDLALWSVGLAVLCGSSANGWRQALTNPPLIAVVLAIVIKHVVGVGVVPPFVMSAFSLLAACAIPMGLVLSGAIIVDFLGESKLGHSWRVVIAAIGFRQCIMPLLMLGAATALIRSEDLRQVMMLQASMPSAIFPVVLIRLYDKDVSTALSVVLSTSLAALILIPFWLGIGQWWLGV
ncbi:AEC family transporter [Planctomycetes bacterium K23_9]|uniref:Membrane transport protein n=1 Tax=Stieleria marina TaxID=1930275 RepID=A0A517NX95_9BACT|nr:Membrane transport protein [Planctomycetes bacterium K23_9]